MRGCKYFSVTVFMFCSHLLFAHAIKIEKELVLLHTNDMHARVMGVRQDDSMCSVEDRDTKACFGGFDRIATQVKTEKMHHPNVLVLDAGDQFQGTVFHQHYRGQVSADLMNHIGYQAMAVGNHEFDDGPEVLAAFAHTAQFPLLSCNIDVSQSSQLKNVVKPYIIVQQQSLRIGILGYTTEETAFLSVPGPQVKFLPIIPAVQKTIATLKKLGVDVIVAISHSGLNQDIQVAQNVSGLAAIVSAHTNSLLSNDHEKADGPSPLIVLSVEKVPVLLVSAYAYGKYLGKLKFTFDNKGRPTSWAGEPILLDHTIRPDSNIRQKIDQYLRPIANLKQDMITVLPTEADGQSCRFKECSLGNMVADSMLAHASPWGAQIALMNGGGIRASLGRGQVTSLMLQDSLPFDKTLVLLTLKGSVIKQIIEHGVFYSEDPKNSNTGRFLQVAGLRYVYNSASPSGQRVKRIFVQKGKDWVLLKLDQTYKVAANSYLVQGGDNFIHFAGQPNPVYMGVELKELLKNYLQSPLSQLPKKEGRIINLATIPKTLSPLPDKAFLASN